MPVSPVRTIYGAHPTAMQTPHLVTIKQAAAALGVDKSALESRLEAGRLKGKKERILSKDTWFIYKTELDQLMQKRSQRLFDEELPFDFTPPHLPAAVISEEEKELTLSEQFQLSLKLMSQEFSECLKQSLVHIHDLREQLRETEGKLLLLTDMEKRAAEDRQLLEDKDDALQAAHERISQLQSEVERLSRPWWRKLLG
jgi:hypothetical protein